jgi:hemerythrin
MSRIEWTEDLEIGIAVIDGQHHRIVDYINALADVAGDHDRKVVRRIIADLIDYTYSHFAFEEALMEEAGYEFLTIHQRTHRSFCERVDQLSARFDAGQDVAEPLVKLLKTWLIQHIMSDDSSYAALVREKMPRIEDRDRGNWLSATAKRLFKN